MLYNVERVIIMKKINCLIFVLQILIIFQLIFVPTISNAGFFDDIFTQADNFISAGEESSASVPDNESIKDISGDIYNILLMIGIVVAVIVGGILGIQFIIASAEDKAKIKEALIPYIIGCIVVFGAFSIWKIIVLFLQ